MSFGDFNEYARFMAWRLRGGDAPLTEQQQLEAEGSLDMYVQRCPKCNKRARPGRGSAKRARECCRGDGADEAGDTDPLNSNVCEDSDGLDKSGLLSPTHGSPTLEGQQAREVVEMLALPDKRLVGAVEAVLRRVADRKLSASQSAASNPHERAGLLHDGPGLRKSG